MPGDPGWYPDPTDPLSERYWDGSNWTERVWTPQVWAPPLPPRPVPASTETGELETTRVRVSAAVVFIMGVQSLFLGLSMIAPILALIAPILTMYVNNRYEDELRADQSPSWMARAGFWMAASTLVYSFVAMVQSLPTLLTVARS